MSERMRNIFQMLKKMKKNKEQDIVCISVGHNNEIVVNQTQYSYQDSIIENSLDNIIYNNNNDNINNNNDNINNNMNNISRSISFLSDNSLNGSNFAEEYKEIETNGLGLREETIIGEGPEDMEIDQKEEINKNITKENTIIESIQEVKNNTKFTTFHVQNKYNVVINLSDRYWNYNTFLNFWRNTVGVCSFFYEGRSCFFEDIILNGYHDVFVL